MFYALIGPLVGASVLFLVVAPLMYGVGENSGYLGIVQGTMAMSLWIVPIAFVLGLVPAIVTGLSHWWLNSRTAAARLPAVPRAVIVAVLGGTACVLFGMTLGAAASDMLSAEILPLFILPGMAAAFGCALLAERRARSRLLS